MAMKKRKVTMQVGEDFFNNLFEPARTNMEKQLGTKVGQVAFSDMIVNSGIKFNVKLKTKKLGKKKNAKKT